MARRREPGQTSADERLARLEKLQWLTAALSAAVTPQQVVVAIFEHGVGASGAWGGNLFWEDDDGRLELVHAFGLALERAEELTRLMAEGQLPVALAWRAGQASWLESRQAILAVAPAAAHCVEEVGDQAWATLPLGIDRPRGALGLRYGEPHRFDEGEREFLLAISRQAAQALERARLFAVQQAQTERLTALQETTAAMAAAATPREVATGVLRGLARLGARGGGLFLRTGDGQLELAYAQGADEALQAALRRLPLEASTPPTDAARAGQPLWLESVEAIRAAYPALEVHRARRGDGVWAALPLGVEGRSFGALAFTLPQGRRLAPADRQLALSLAQQAAQALERARLFEAQERLARRLASVHGAAAAVSGAVTPGEVAVAAKRALEVQGIFAVELWATAGDHVDRVASEGDVCACDALEAPPRVGVDAPHPVAEVARVGRAIWLESPAIFAARWPHLDAARASAGIAACALIPLLAGGRTLGVLAVGWDEPRAFLPEDRGHLRLVALPCAYALERAVWRHPTPGLLPALTSRWPAG